MYHMYKIYHMYQEGSQMFGKVREGSKGFYGRMYFAKALR